MNVDDKLQKYIEENIFPMYSNNYIGDDISRIDYVISRSNQIIKENSLKMQLLVNLLQIMNTK